MEYLPYRKLPGRALGGGRLSKGGVRCHGQLLNGIYLEIIVPTVGSQLPDCGDHIVLFQKTQPTNKEYKKFNTLEADIKN